MQTRMWALLLLLGSVPAVGIRVTDGMADMQADIEDLGETVAAKAHGGGRGEPGYVSGVYAYGAPASASPPLINRHSSGPCFQGYRFWTARYHADHSGHRYIDMASTCTGVLGYRHPVLASAELNVEENTSIVYECNATYETELPTMPRGLPKVIHDTHFYIQGATPLSSWLKQVSEVGIGNSFTQDPLVARESIEAEGWLYRGSAFHEGNNVSLGKGGPQVVHLIQDPLSQVCIMTFQGTSSPRDWLSDFAVKKVHFCGLTDEHEKCSKHTYLGQCNTKPGHSFVHVGFRDHLRDIIRSDGWQQNIRPHLPQCAEVQVAGHSLGGAVAELFAACVNRAPQPGEYGYEEDYKWMKWTRHSKAAPASRGLGAVVLLLAAAALLGAAAPA